MKKSVLILMLLVANCFVHADPIPSSLSHQTRKSEADWKKILTHQEFHVLREKGTERAFTGEFWKHHEEGVYKCRACGLELFDSKTKFDSGTGWPSFFSPIKNGHVIEELDRSYGMVRTEVLCGGCLSHLGHVFNDGPKPTGLRYCINSICLTFMKR